MRLLFKLLNSLITITTLQAISCSVKIKLMIPKRLGP